MKFICNDLERMWDLALMQKHRGVDDELIQKDVERMTKRLLGDFCSRIASEISDGQNHIIKLVKHYWTDEDFYKRCSLDPGRVFGPYKFNFHPSDAEWVKSLNPYDAYFMIDEDGQLQEARNLLFPEDSFSVTVLKHNHRDSEVTEETYHRNCATCLYYEGSRKCPGHAPCLCWDKSVMFNEYCSRWTEDIID